MWKNWHPNVLSTPNCIMCYRWARGGGGRQLYVLSLWDNQPAEGRGGAGAAPLDQEDQETVVNVEAVKKSKLWQDNKLR